MSSYDHVAYLADVTAIELVKYRYLRALDTKHWDDFAETLTEDVIGDYGSSMGEEHHFTNRSDLVEYMRSSLGPNVITEHRVTHPEITVTGDEATGIWYLQDRVIAIPAPGRSHWMICTSLASSIATQPSVAPPSVVWKKNAAPLPG